MSGSNGIVKYPKCNREEELILKYRGPEYKFFDFGVITAAALTAQQFISDLQFTALTPNALTGPTAKDVALLQSTLSSTQPGQGFKVLYQNTDVVNAKTITFGAGFTPASYVIGPGESVEFAWELTAQNPAAYNLVAALRSSNATSAFSAAAAVDHDGLTYVASTGLWTPTNALATGFHTNFHGIQSIDGSIGINANLLSAVSQQSNNLTVTSTTNSVGGQARIIRADALSPFGSTGTGINFFSTMLANGSTVNPPTTALPGLGVGLYHYTGNNLAAGGTTTFYVTRDGQVRMTPRVIAMGAPLTWDAASGEISVGASLDIYKTNVQELADLTFLEKIPEVRSFELTDNNMNRLFVSEFANAIHSNPDLTANQKKILLEYQYLSPYDPEAEDFDPAVNCNQEQFPTGKYDFDHPLNINTISLLTIVKGYMLDKFADLEERIAALEAV